MGPSPVAEAEAEFDVVLTADRVQCRHGSKNSAHPIPAFVSIHTDDPRVASHSAYSASDVHIPALSSSTQTIFLRPDPVSFSKRGNSHPSRPSFPSCSEGQLLAFCVQRHCCTKKTVLITGASRGLGLQFTEHYVKAGWRVIGTARNLASVEKLKALAPWQTVALDAADDNSILYAARELEGVPIDLVINNAGVLTSNGVANSTKADIMQQFEINAVGPFLTTRALLPNLKLAAQANGHAMVAQITSRMGSVELNESGGYIGYRASKTALNMISTSLSKDLAQDKIGIVMLHPGYVSTEMSSGVGDITPEQSIQYLTTILDRVGLQDSGKFFHYEGFELKW